MDDLIKREKLQAELCKACGKCKQIDDHGGDPLPCWIYNLIDNQIAVNRCIPCSERLPEKSGLYLTYQKELGRFQLMRYSPVLRNGTGWFDDNYGLYVTHWMSLPEPPEVTQDEQT